nr:serine/threonine-protein kinase TOUSLED isoform X1 [Ipomoea batatas]
MRGRCGGKKKRGTNKEAEESKGDGKKERETGNRLGCRVHENIRRGCQGGGREERKEKERTAKYLFVSSTMHACMDKGESFSSRENFNKKPAGYDIVPKDVLANDFLRAIKLSDYSSDEINSLQAKVTALEEELKRSHKEASDYLHMYLELEKA